MEKLKNLLIISIDSLRPEALGCYPKNFSIYETFPYVVKTPTLDSLASEGALFTNMIVQAPFTPASYASFLTGLNPPSHGIRQFFGYRLSEKAETLSERLKEKGFHTCAIIGADALNSRYGLNKGFDVYDERFNDKIVDWFEGQYRRAGEETTERGLQWLETCKEPFFLFLHYFDVHLIAPHVLAKNDKVARILWELGQNTIAPKPIRKVFRAPEMLYARWRRCGKPFHVRQTQKIDQEISRLIHRLKKLGLYEQTLIVIFSDHGDSFGEHGERGHGKHLYDTTLRTPFIIKGPSNQRGKVIHSMVRSIDVVPTIHELLDINMKPNPKYKPLEGESMVPLINGQETESRIAYSETRMGKTIDDVRNLERHFFALRTSQWKLIVNLLDGKRELYNLKDDFREVKNQVSHSPDIVENLYKELMNIYADEQEDTSAHRTYDQEEQHEIKGRLRDLGYI